jgi:hypothetical protein
MSLIGSKYDQVRPGKDLKRNQSPHTDSTEEPAPYSVNTEKVE